MTEIPNSYCSQGAAANLFDRGQGPFFLFWPLDIGTWDLFGAWCLGFGAYSS
jgi:hypothetical protein